MDTKITKASRKEQEIAAKTIDEFARVVSGRKSKVVKIKIEEDGEFISVPRKAFDLFVDVLSNMSDGKVIYLTSSDLEVSTQQAAEILNVSRPHVVKLLEQGKIPHKKIGSHRRVLLKDLMQYDEKLRTQNTNSLKKLAKQAQELGLGYE